MDIQVYRVNKSSYQDSEFFKYEKEKLESINGIKYISSLADFSHEIPFILLTNTHTCTQEIPEIILKKTLLIVHPNSGYDNFTLDFVQNSNIPIILGNSVRSNAVAEFTLSCIFQHFTHIPDHKHWSSSRTWERSLLRDQKVLILGHGNIGKTLYSSLSCLCKDVTVYDPYVKFDMENFSQKNQWDDSLLDECNILILACGLNDLNRHFIDISKLKKLSSNVLIINPARGELINETDLVQFLQKNPKAKCYLDVFENEPFKPGHLHEAKNINKTSHIAGVFENLNKDIVDFEYNCINNFINKYEENKLELFYKEYRQSILKNKIINDLII